MAWAPGQEPWPCREAPPDPRLQQPPCARLLFLHGPRVGPGPAFPRGRGPGALGQAWKASFSLLPTWFRGSPRPARAARARTAQQKGAGAGPWAPAASHSHSSTGHHPPPGSPGRSYQEGCLPVGIGPADLVTCLQGSTETLRVAAGSPRGGRCSSRAQLHLWLREDQASLTLSHCVSGRVGRGCGGAHLPTCCGAGSTRG